MSEPSVSVLLVQWGETDLTERAVEAARRSHYDGLLELLVWDNASPEGPGAEALATDIVLVESAENVGFGTANNELAARATGELLLFLNNDTILAPSCLGRMVECLTKNEGVAAVTPQFRSFGGEVLELGGYVGNSGEGWQLLRGERPPRSLLERPFPAHYGSAACLLVKRDVFLEVGGFDELFSPAYYEDTDLCLRLVADHGRVLVEPRAIAYHMEGGTAGTDISAGAKRFQLRNRGRFVARWSRRLESQPPISQASALRQALCGDGDRPLVLWLMPDFLKPDQSGGHARARREIEALVESGTAVVVWSEHVGDQGRYGRFLTELGVTWCGAHEPSRSLLGDRLNCCIGSLEDLLRLQIWDAVVAWSADLAHRFGPVIREHAPKAAFVVDSAVLVYLQCQRGVTVGAALGEDLITEKAWELEAYSAADGLVASSEADAAVIRAELPHLDVVAFDVGAYEPVAVADEAERGSLLFLGSFTHPPNMDAIAWWVDEIAPRIEELSGREMPLRVIGSSSELVSEVIGANGHLDVVGWVEDLRQEMARARLFVVPLRYGAGTKDKIAMAMRYGVPTVTTSIGAESMPSELHRALVVADAPNQFASHVVRLMANDGQWKRVADSTRRAAQLAWRDQERAKRGLVTWFSQFTAR